MITSKTLWHSYSSSCSRLRGSFSLHHYCICTYIIHRKNVLIHLYTNEKVTPGQWFDRPPRLSRYFQLEDDGSLDVRMITDEFRLADIRVSGYILSYHVPF